MHESLELVGVNNERGKNPHKDANPKPTHFPPALNRPNG